MEESSQLEGEYGVAGPAEGYLEGLFEELKEVVVGNGSEGNEEVVLNAEGPAVSERQPQKDLVIVEDEVLS